MGRAPCCDKANVKKGPWSPEEDAKLKAYIEQFGTGGNWIALPQKIGLKRCGKSCRLRWLNYLRPNIKHGGFSEEEDNIICSLYISIGSRWSIIAAQLPGRTDNDIKNYWNTRLKKKLLGRRKQSHINRLSATSQDSKDANSVENLSSSAIERLQLHMQLQSLPNPFSFYTNPALWPKLNPLQEKMIQQSLQLVNDSSNPNHSNPDLMQNVSPISPQLGGQQIDALYQSSNQDYSVLVDELEDSINGMPASPASKIPSKAEINMISGSSSCIQKSDGKLSNNMEFQGIPTFQAELDDFLMNNNQMGEFDCFKEMDSSKDIAIWWSGDFDTNSASSNSWDSTSVLHQQSEVGCQEFVQGYSMH